MGDRLGKSNAIYIYILCIRGVSVSFRGEVAEEPLSAVAKIRIFFWKVQLRGKSFRNNKSKLQHEQSTGLHFFALSRLMSLVSSPTLSCLNPLTVGNYYCNYCCCSLRTKSQEPYLRGRTCFYCYDKAKGPPLVTKSDELQQAASRISPKEHLSAKPHAVLKSWTLKFCTDV